MLLKYLKVIEADMGEGLQKGTVEVELDSKYVIRLLKGDSISMTCAQFEMIKL